MSASPYRKLTPKRRSLTGFTQAWLGADHLLIVNSNHYVERYQRFSFPDIQAVVVTQTPARLIAWPLAVLVVSLAWALLALRFHSAFGRGFFVVTALPGVVFFLIDKARGPRCRCVLQTAVSREPIAAVAWVGHARKFLAALAPAVEAVQGSVPAEELAQVQVIDAPQGSELPHASEKPPELHQPLTYAPEIFFGIMLLDSALAWYTLHSPVVIAFGLLPTIYIAEIILGILALVRARSRSTASVVLVVIAALYIPADIFLLSGPVVVRGFLVGVKNIPPSWNFMMRTSPVTMVLSAGLRAAVGLFGLLACWIERRGEGE